MSNHDLKGLFEAYQKKLEADLGVTGAIAHPTSKGDVAELSWLEMLSSYLPKRYRAVSGFVIDSKNKVSGQQDIIVVDRHFSPFILNHQGAIYVPAESVYAIFEVKPTLTKDYMIYAGKKAQSVRQLKRTAAPIVHAGGKYMEPKPPPPILAGILTTDSEWNPALGETFRGHLACLAGASASVLNLGCVAKHGTFELVDHEDGSNVEVGTASTGVMSFFLTLVRRLQALGSVPAIDLTEYSKHVESGKSGLRRLTGT